MKKISERKSNARPRHTSSSVQSDSPGIASLGINQSALCNLKQFLLNHTLELVLFTFQCNLKMITRNFSLQQMLP